jgi:NADH:ubiquinone oxidoreductase subunit B-like Fe-S oxidoreductase
MVEAGQVPRTGEFNVLVGKVNEILQDAIGAPLRYMVNWGRLYSLWPVHLETACCVPPDTIVLGDNKPISQYVVSDKVAGVTGLVDVKQTFSRRYDGKLARIIGRGMLPILATPEHPILTVERSLSWGKGTYGNLKRWKNAGELVPSPPVKKDGKFLCPKGSHDCLLIPRPKGFIDSTTIPLASYATKRGLNIVLGRGMNPPLEFPLTSETAWLLGIFVAEGWDTDGHDVFFSLSHDEKGLISRIYGIVESLGYSPQIKRRETATVVRFSSAILARAFHDWCGHLAENKKIPDFILYHNDLTLLRSFLVGYLQGDGADIIDARGPEFDRADTTSKTLALQIQLAYARFGEFARINLKAKGGPSKILGRDVITHDSYTISILSSDRKTYDFQVTPDFIAVPIRKVELVEYSGTVNNLETADNTYLVSNAVVHNCSVEVGAASGSRFDAERFGVLEAFGSLRQCDLIIVMGTVTRKLAPRLKLIYDQMPEPKWVIAMGACERGDSMIYTPSGLRRIDEIQPGEVIFSYDEVAKQVVSARVSAWKDQGVRPVIRVRAGSFESVATEDHPLAVYERTLSRKWVSYRSMLGMVEEGFSLKEVSPFLGIGPKTLSYWKKHPPPMYALDLNWKQVRELSEGDLLVTYSQPVEGTAFPIQYSHQGRFRKQVRIPDSVNDALAWLVGLYLGDGWKDSHRIGFSLMEKDPSRAELVRVINELFGISPHEGRQVLIWSSVIAGMFKESLLLEGNVHTKRIPSWVYTIPLSSVLSFLAGLIESDGYVQEQGFAQVSSANKELMLDLVELCHYRGLHVGGVFEKEREHVLEGRQLKTVEYIVSFPLSLIARLPLHRSDYQRRVKSAVHVFDGTSLLRTNHAGIGLQRITSLVPRGRDSVYDLEVEGYHNFFANGQLVHNCSITGGLYFDSYNVLRGIDDIIPVDVYVPGCPPRAESLIQGVALLQDKIRHSTSLRGT